MVETEITIYFIYFIANVKVTKKHVPWDPGVLSSISHKTVTDAVFPGNGKCTVVETVKQNTE